MSKTFNHDVSHFSSKHKSISTSLDNKLSFNTTPLNIKDNSMQIMNNTSYSPPV